MNRTLLAVSFLFLNGVAMSAGEAAILPGADIPQTFINERYTCYLYPKYVALTDTRAAMGQRVTFVFPKRDTLPKKACVVATDGSVLEVSQPQGQLFLAMGKDTVFIQSDRDGVPNLVLFHFKEKKKLFEQPFVPDLPFYVQKKTLVFFQFPPAGSATGVTCSKADEIPALEMQVDLGSLKAMPSGKSRCAPKPPVPVSSEVAPTASTDTVPVPSASPKGE